MLPALSIAIEIRLFPVVSKTVDVPSGVIFETSFVRELVVKTLPFLSIAIPSGVELVDPRIVDMPFGVIFETVFVPMLVV